MNTFIMLANTQFVENVSSQDPLSVFIVIVLTTKDVSPIIFLNKRSSSS